MCWIRVGYLVYCQATYYNLLVQIGSHTTLTLLLYEQLRAWAGVRPL